MIFDFDDLEKRCRRYHRKKYLLPALLLLLLVGVALYIFFPFHKPSAPLTLQASSSSSSRSAHISSSVASSSSEVAHSSSSLAKKPVQRCFAIQLFYGYDRYIDKLLEYNEKAKKVGFSCHIKRGRMLQNGNRQLFLVCNTQKTKKALQPWIDLAKRSGLDYTIVRDDCTHLSSTTPPQKPNPKSKPKPKATPAPSTPQVVSAKELTTAQLEKLFAQRHSYDLAIQIARSYYNSGKYKKALKWAKKANALDRQQEEAWILYAKSLKKMGEDAKARQILRVYLDYKESSKARKLLKEWQ